MELRVEQIDGRGPSSPVKRVVLALVIVSPLVALFAFRLQLRGGAISPSVAIAIFILLVSAVALSILKLHHQRNIVMHGLIGPVLRCQGTYRQLWTFLDGEGHYAELRWFGQDVRQARSDVLIDVGQTPAIFEFVNAWGPPSHGRLVAPSHLAEVVVGVRGSAIRRVSLTLRSGERLLLEAGGDVDGLLEGNDAN